MRSVVAGMSRALFAMIEDSRAQVAKPVVDTRPTSVLEFSIGLNADERTALGNARKQASDSHARSLIWQRHKASNTWQWRGQKPSSGSLVTLLPGRALGIELRRLGSTLVSPLWPTP